MSQRTAPSPITWAAWAAAVLPVVGIVGFALVDFEGYLRAVVEASSGGTSLPPGAVGPFIGFAAVSMVDLLRNGAFVVLAAIDFRILRARGIQRPFHWAWGFVGLLNSGALVYLIGRTVVGRDRTGRSASGPLWLWVSLTVVGIAVSLIKLATAFAAVAPLLGRVAGSP